MRERSGPYDVSGAPVHPVDRKTLASPAPPVTAEDIAFAKSALTCFKVEIQEHLRDRYDAAVPRILAALQKSEGNERESFKNVKGDVPEQAIVAARWSCNAIEAALQKSDTGETK